ncbi:MAG: diaminobutyrate--2-oxoglutarate transaminase family protein [bacterium]|nr:diaminobutyrate--2-oxoglutarate transaminase family protein [bacterium]
MITSATQYSAAAADAKSPAGIPGQTEELLAFQAGIESNARSYPRRLPMVIQSARGARVTDTDGREYIDCLACAGALPLGHNHPGVNAAVIEYLQNGGPWQTLDLMTPAKAAYIETLFGLLPPGWRDRYRIQFCGPGGSDAVEAAVKLVKFATGRDTMLAFRGAYHGMSHFSLGLTGNLKAKRRMPGLATGIHFLPYPDLYRTPLQTSGDLARGGANATPDETQITAQNLQYIKQLMHDPESGMTAAAGMILELVQGEGGVNPAPLEWVRGLRELTHEAGIPLIVDEVQTGLGRTGNLFAFEAAGIEPDVLVLSKAIGGGFPISVVLFREELNLWPPGAHAGTFRGNQLAMVAGRRTMQIIAEDGLIENVRSVGEALRAGLEGLRSRHAMIAQIRGRGLMLGAEIIQPDGQLDPAGFPAAAPDLAARIQQECFRRGLILEVGGRFGSVLRFLPPLNIDFALVHEIVSILGEAIISAADDAGDFA